MSRAPTLDENRALHRLTQSGDGKHLLTLLESRLKEYDKNSRRMTGDVLNQINGKRQELESLLDIFENANINARAGEKP